MTRAAERLIVCGMRSDKKIPDGCWYDLVRDALEADCVAEPADDGAAKCCVIAKDRRWRLNLHRPPLRASRRRRCHPGCTQDAPPDSRRDHRHAVERRRTTRWFAQSHAAIAPRRCCAAPSCIGCCNRCRISPPTTAPRPCRTIWLARRRTDGRGAKENRRASDARARGSALLRAVCPRQPRRSSDHRPRRHWRQNGSRLRPGRPAGCDAKRCADCRFQDQPAARRGESRKCRRHMSTSSRSIAPCCKNFIRTGPCAPRCIWTEVPDLMELSAGRSGCRAGAGHTGVTALDASGSRS